MLYRLIATAVIIVLGPIIQWVLKISIHRIAEGNQLKASRARLVSKIIRTTWLMFVGLVLISIWGLDVKNVWLFVTGIAGMVAIGFFAIWSLLSNIVAGFFLFLFHPFRIDDEILILPEGIQGIVVDITTAFVVLRAEDGSHIHVPNNLCFQKFIKVTPSAGT